MTATIQPFSRWLYKQREKAHSFIVQSLAMQTVRIVLVFLALSIAVISAGLVRDQPSDIPSAVNGEFVIDLMSSYRSALQERRKWNKSLVVKNVIVSRRVVDVCTPGIINVTSVVDQVSFNAI